MAGIPKVKITFDADFDDLKKGIKGSQAEVETFADKVGEFGKKAAVAFGIAGAAIGSFALASVKAAAEDEVGQKKLQETIRNTTSATAEQIAGIDKYVTAQSIATATSDEVIRPALSRLLRATGDLSKSQELLTLAQEISTATGKPLEAVTNAVAKSFEGSNTALGKLGLVIDAATLKTLSFDETQQLLNKTFDGFIENQSSTAAFKFEQISIAVNESKEAIGAALLPVVKQFADFLIITAVPALEAFVSGLTGSDGLNTGLSESQIQAVAWGKKIRSILDTIVDFKDELIAVAAVMTTIFVVNKISAGVVATIALINTLMKAYNALKASAIITGVATAFALNPLLGVGAVALAAGVLAGAAALSGSSDVDEIQMPSTGAIPFLSGFAPATGNKPVIPSLFPEGGVSTAVKSAAKAATTVIPISGADAARKANADKLAPTTINLTVNGALDSEGTARTIVNTVNNSFYRGSGGANNFLIT